MWEENIKSYLVDMCSEVGLSWLRLGIF